MSVTVVHVCVRAI